MGKREFIEAHLEEPALKQRWPNYKQRLHQIERMYEQRSQGGPVTEPAASEPDMEEAFFNVGEALGDGETREEVEGDTISADQIAAVAEKLPSLASMRETVDKASTQPGDDDAERDTTEAEAKPEAETEAPEAATE